MDGSWAESGGPDSDKSALGGNREDIEPKEFHDTVDRAYYRDMLHAGVNLGSASPRAPD